MYIYIMYIIYIIYLHYTHTHTHTHTHTQYLLRTRRRSASRDQSHDTECPPASRRLSHTRPSSSTRTDPCRGLTTSEFDQ